MKTMFNIISMRSVLLLVILLGMMSCKKSEEQLDSATIQRRLSGEDSTLWRFPSSLQEGCENAAQPLLLLRSNATYLYTQGSCTFYGSWAVTYSSNRSGQDITLELIDQGGGGVRRVKLMYSKDNNAFYYVDPEKGLLLLTREVIAGSMTWVPKVFPTMPTSFLGRINTVSVSYGDTLIYFGLGEDHTGTIAYNDWYSFDGTQFVQRTNIGPYPIVGAKALVVKDGGEDKIYVLGGQFVEGNYMDNSLTYVYDPGKDSWNTEYEEEGIQQRFNPVYFMFNNQEIVGLGSVGSSGTNFYTRANISQPWTERTEPIVYGFPAHDYQDALCFPWNGGYFVGGGKMQSSENLLGFSLSWIDNSIGELTTTPTTPNNGLGFSEGMGVDMGSYSLVYGINTNGSGPAVYSKYVYTLDHTGKWSAVIPSASPGMEPIPGRSSVLWKIRNAQGKTEVYGGLGSNPLSILYQLKIQ